jgi:hypothetical protein
METNNFFRLLACAGVYMAASAPTISVAGEVRDSVVEEDVQKEKPSKPMTPFCHEIFIEGEYSLEKSAPAGTNKGCSKNAGCTVRNTGCGKK